MLRIKDLLFVQKKLKRGKGLSSFILFCVFHITPLQLSFFLFFFPSLSFLQSTKHKVFKVLFSGGLSETFYRTHFVLSHEKR